MSHEENRRERLTEEFEFCVASFRLWCWMTATRRQPGAMAAWPELSLRFVCPAPSVEVWRDVTSGAGALYGLHDRASQQEDCCQFANNYLYVESFRARKIRAHSRILRLEREVLRPENLVQSQLCA